MAIITISRGTFSGGQAIATSISNELGYHCITREELLEEAARNFDISEAKLDIAMEKKPGFLERNKLRRIHYIAYIQATLIKMVKDENVAYSGMAGHLLLQEAPNVLKVKVIADMEYRIKAAMERDNFSRDEAIEYIRKVDNERNGWVKAVYNIDRNDPVHYDLVVNLEHMTLTTASEVICAVARHPEFQRTAETRKKMEDLVFASDIRAKIAMDRNITDTDIHVTADDGFITVTGETQRLDDADRIRALVRQLPGVKDIESHIKVIQS